MVFVTCGQKQISIDLENYEGEEDVDVSEVLVAKTAAARLHMRLVP